MFRSLLTVICITIYICWTTQVCEAQKPSYTGTSNSGFTGDLPGDKQDEPSKNSKKPEFTSAELETFSKAIQSKEQAKLKADAVIEAINKKIQAAIKQAEAEAAPSLEVFHKAEADFNVIYWEYVKVHGVDYRKWILQLDENQKPIWVDIDTLPKNAGSTKDR